MIKKGEWVLIESIVLKSGERAGNLPEDTKKVDMVKWVKGYLNADADIGGRVSVTTVTGRTERGILKEANPVHRVDYGAFVPELLEVRRQVKEIMFGGGGAL